jgi:hypothetical protein
VIAKLNLNGCITWVGTETTAPVHNLGPSAHPGNAYLYSVALDVVAGFKRTCRFGTSCHRQGSGNISQLFEMVHNGFSLGGIITSYCIPPHRLPCGGPTAGIEVRVESALTDDNGEEVRHKALVADLESAKPH